MASKNHALRILYVDDEAVNLRLMRDVFAMVLERPDAVVTAESAEEALRLLQTEAFDVVVSDQRMPGMCGTALLARVRERWPRSARVILTGYPSDAEVQQALGAGVAEVIVPKPWKAKELEGTLESLVAQKGPRIPMS